MALNFMDEFKPKLFESLKTYTREKFIADLMSGVVVAVVVALPLAIAFAIASGVSPEKGLFTAIIAGFIVAFFGGTSVQIAGPTGAFIIIIYGIIEQFGIEGLALATALAGIIQILMGALKLGSVIKFIPHPIVVGFTSGIAVTIFSTQIKDFFGLTTPTLPGDFFAKWNVYIDNFSSIDIWTTGIALASILIIIVTPRIFKKVPGSLIAIIFMTLTSYLLNKYAGIDSIETIGDRFTIQSSLPKMQKISFNLESIGLLFPSAFTLAILGSIESLLSAVVADGMIGRKHNSNMELIAQGMANLVAPFFGGLPATGAVARTMTNINNGGRTPVAGIVHAIVLLLILLFLGGLTEHIPMACLAGILVVVSYNMSEWRTFLALSKHSKSTMLILLTTFTLTIVFGLTIAIQVGLLLSVFIFIKRMNETTQVSVATEEIDLSKEIESHSGNLEDEVLHIPTGVEVYEIDGPFFFGVANKFDEVMRELGDEPNVRIIRMRKVPFIDSTGLYNLEALCRSAKRDNIQIILSGVLDSVYDKLMRSEVPKLVGQENICNNIHLALDRATVINHQMIQEEQAKLRSL